MSDSSGDRAGCPPLSTLARFLWGELPDDCLEATNRHVEECPHCLSALDRLLVPADEPGRALVPSQPSPPPTPPARGGYGQRVLERIGESLPNPRIGEYEILSPLAHGVMGEVYRARHVSLDRPVALKLLPSALTRNAGAVALFRQSVCAVGRLRHANVVEAYDASEVDGVQYLAMELVDGMNLSQLLRLNGPLRLPDACEIVRQAAEGLHHCHQSGCVHRDVKPSNLLLDRQGTVKVTDFGLAFLVEDLLTAEWLAGDSAAQELLGTPDFMAPEQFADPAHVDARADVYALGCTLYTLLTAAHPFRPAATAGHSEGDVHQQFPLLIAKQDELPGSLRDLFEQMVAPRPADRIQTAKEVADRLEPLARGANLLGLVGQHRVSADPANPEAAGSSGVPTHARRRHAFWLVGVALLLGAAGVVWTWPPSTTSAGKVGQPPAETVPSAPASREWIVDDTDPGFRAEGEDRSWRVSKLQVGYLGGHTYNEEGAQTASWTFDNLPPGRYEVFATWPDIGADRCTRRLVYRLFDTDDEIAAVTVNQQIPPDDEQAQGCRWKRLRSLSLQTNRLVVEVDARRSQGPGAVRLDAIRIVRQSE